MKKVRNGNYRNNIGVLPLTKEGRKAIIASMNDTSFSKSFLRQYSNQEIDIFQDYEKSL